jgi:methyl-accepting chemotaxis protein
VTDPGTNDPLQSLLRRVNDLEHAQEMQDQHVRDAMNRMSEAITAFGELRREVAEMSRGVRQAQLTADEARSAVGQATQRLDGIRPLTLNCPHCSRKASPGQKTCGYCGKTL